MIVPFPIPRPGALDYPRGVVFVFPSGIAGGTWCVVHKTSTGLKEVVGNYLTLDQAVEVARAFAQASGARFAE